MNKSRLHPAPISSEKGFTLIEIMLAMAVFSFVLMITVAGFVQVNRQYTKGITVRKAQDSARTIVEQIGREIRTSKIISFNKPDRKLCINDNILYTWSLANSGSGFLGTTGERLIRHSGGSGGNCNSSGATRTEMLVPNTYPIEFNVDSNGNLHKVTIGIVVESDDNIIGGTDFSDGLGGYKCSTNPADQAFCYIVEYSTSVRSL